MKTLELNIKLDTAELSEELSQLTTLLKEADQLIDSISSKLKNLTVIRDTHQ